MRTSDTIEMMESPSILADESSMNTAPKNLEISRRRSNRKVSVGSEDQCDPSETFIFASTKLTANNKKSPQILGKLSTIHTLKDRIQEISASEDSDSDTSFVANPFQFASPAINKASSEGSLALPAELKELAHLIEWHHRDELNSTKRDFDVDWILARASPALKTHIALNKNLFSSKSTPLNAIVQPQWYHDFRNFQSQVRIELKESETATSVSLIPPFQPMANTKMPLVLQELAHILEVHDYNFRPSKQGQISWDWVLEVSSPVLAKHILRKQNDPNVRKSYRKCPTAALVTSTHYTEFRLVRGRIWNQLMSQQPTKTSIAVTPLCYNFTSKSKATLKVMRSSVMATDVTKKSPVPPKVKKGINTIITPKVTVTTMTRKRGPKKTSSILTSEQRELAHLLEEIRLRDRSKRVVFDKDYIQANASPALTAYIAERSVMPTFQKNILRALVSVNKKNNWEDFRLQLREHMQKGVSDDGLVEEIPFHFKNVGDKQERPEKQGSAKESEPETIHRSTLPNQTIVDMRHHAVDASWLAPSQRLQILESAENECLSDISDDDAAMVLDKLRNAKRTFPGVVPMSKRSRLGDAHLSFVDVKTAVVSFSCGDETNELPVILRELARLLEDHDFIFRYPDRFNWEWIKNKATPDLCFYLSQTHEIFPGMTLDDIIPSYSRSDFDSFRDKIRVDLGTKGIDIYPCSKQSKVILSYSTLWILL